MSVVSSLDAVPYHGVEGAWSLVRPIPELVTIFHRTASSSLDSWWEFIPKGGFPEQPNRILASIKLASAPAVEVEIPVSSHRHPVPDTWIIVRKGEHYWLITAALLPLDMQTIVRSHAFHPNLPIGSIVLAEAPSEISEELARI